MPARSRAAGVNGFFKASIFQKLDGRLRQSSPGVDVADARTLAAEAASNSLGAAAVTDRVAAWKVCAGEKSR
jgi:hypothetical protein